MQSNAGSRDAAPVECSGTFTTGCQSIGDRQNMLSVSYFHSQHLLTALPSGATSYSPTKPMPFKSAYFADAV